MTKLPSPKLLVVLTARILLSEPLVYLADFFFFLKKKTAYLGLILRFYKLLFPMPFCRLNSLTVVILGCNGTVDEKKRSFLGCDE